jgi:hypothetical protein
VPSDIPKSQIYRECIPLFTRGLVRLPDHAVLLRELRLLERTTHRGGKASSYQQVAWRSSAGVRNDAGERRPHLRR